MTVNTAVNKQKMQYGAPTKNIPKKTFKNSHALKYKKKYTKLCSTALLVALHK